MFNIFCKAEGRKVLTRPLPKVLKRKQTAVFGMFCKFTEEIDRKTEEYVDSIDKKVRENWQEREANGIRSVLMDLGIRRWIHCSLIPGLSIC